MAAYKRRPVHIQNLENRVIDWSRRRRGVSIRVIKEGNWSVVPVRAQNKMGAIFVPMNGWINSRWIHLLIQMFILVPAVPTTKFTCQTNVDNVFMYSEMYGVFAYCWRQLGVYKKFRGYKNQLFKNVHQTDSLKILSECRKYSSVVSNEKVKSQFDSTSLDVVCNPQSNVTPISKMHKLKTTFQNKFLKFLFFLILTHSFICFPLSFLICHLLVQHIL